MLGDDERLERLPDELIRRVAREGLTRRVGSQKPAVNVERVHRVRVMLEQRPISLLALPQTIVRDPPVGDVLEEDRDAARIGENAVLEPSIVRRIVCLDLLRCPLRYRPLVCPMEWLADPFGKLGPDVLTDERRRVAFEHPAGVRVHIRVAPIGVERDEPVTRCLEDARQRLTRLLRLTAPADELSDERPNAGVKREDLAIGTGRGVRELLLEPRETLVERRVHLRRAAVVTFDVRMPSARCTRPAILYVPRSVALIARRVVRS